jgi:hypothetical protein
MHVQVVTFNLQGATEAQYRALCDELAPAFAEMPGLISKVWLADPATNTYGGVYLWRDRASYEVYLSSDIFKGVGANPALANISSRDFGILEGPSALTHTLTLAAT